MAGGGEAGVHWGVGGSRGRLVEAGGTHGQPEAASPDTPPVALGPCMLRYT